MDLFNDYTYLVLMGLAIVIFVVAVTIYFTKRKVKKSPVPAFDESSEDRVEEIVNSALHFSEETVGEVMIPRVNIVDLTLNATFTEVMNCVIENNYSRIPVTDASHDKVKGILYVKDLLRYRNENENFKWQSLLRTPYFVPESKMIGDLLREFQRNKVHIAIVVDEYGSISGMVTMEDILEEIVGEIQDEYDDETPQYEKAADGSFVFEGKTPIADFFEAIDQPREDYEDCLGEAETIAGFVLELMNEIPTVGQQIDCKNLTFQVLEMERQRLSKIKVNLRSDE